MDTYKHTYLQIFNVHTEILRGLYGSLTSKSWQRGKMSFTDTTNLFHEALLSTRAYKRNGWYTTLYRPYVYWKIDKRAGILYIKSQLQCCTQQIDYRSQPRTSMQNFCKLEKHSVQYHMVGITSQKIPTECFAKTFGAIVW